MSNLENTRFQVPGKDIHKFANVPSLATRLHSGKLGGYRLQETATFVDNDSQKSTCNLGIANVDIIRVIQ